MKRKFTTNSRVITDLFAQYKDTFTAFCELVNNSLQAGSSTIEINIDYTPIQEVSPLWIKSIEIKDDGVGVGETELNEKLFQIGTSSKDGGKGIGRFSALQIGNKVDIESIAFNKDSSTFSHINIPIYGNFFKSGKQISEIEFDTTESTIEEEAKTYYKVTISDLYDNVITESHPKRKLTDQFRLENIKTSIFEKYPIKIFNKEIKFYINAEYLDPKDFVIGTPENILSHYKSKKGQEHDFYFTYFSINSKILDKVKVFLTVNNAGIQSVAGTFEYSADKKIPIGNYFIYVESKLFTVDMLRNFDLDDFDEEGKHVKAFIRDSISNFFISKTKPYENFVQKFRSDEYNPFKNHAPSSSSHKAIVEHTAFFLENDFSLISNENPLRGIIYTLLERAISNGDLQAVLDKVKNLDDYWVSKFKTLLEKAELESIIEFSERVAQKLHDLEFLEKITCGDLSKYINERKDLHVWLVKLNMMWLFGEHYNDATNLLSDKGLENNLFQLREEIMKYSKSEEFDNFEIIENADIQSITDLFLYSEKILDIDKREVLIVELKAPHVKISTKELNQAQKYAFDIGKKSFFPRNIKYKIILISSDLSEMAKHSLKGTSSNKRNNPYFYWESEDKNIEILVIRWIDLIEENKRRLTYMSKALHVKDKSVQETIEEKFGNQEFEKIKARLYKTKK